MLIFNHLKWNWFEPLSNFRRNTRTCVIVIRLSGLILTPPDYSWFNLFLFTFRTRPKRTLAYSQLDFQGQGQGQHFNLKFWLQWVTVTFFFQILNRIKNPQRLLDASLPNFFLGMVHTLPITAGHFWSGLEFGKRKSRWPAAFKILDWNVELDPDLENPFANKQVFFLDVF